MDELMLQKMKRVVTAVFMAEDNIYPQYAEKFKTAKSLKERDLLFDSYTTALAKELLKYTEKQKDQ